MSDRLPPNPTAEDYYRVGLSLDSEYYEAAIDFFEQALMLDPNHVGACCGLSDKLQWEGRWAEALTYCDRALAIDPNCFDAWRHRGGALHHLERYDEALESYNRAIALNPETRDDDLWSNQGRMLAGSGQLEAAIASYNRAIELRLNPEDGSVNSEFLNYSYADKGSALLKLGRYEEAIVTCEQADYLEQEDEHDYFKAYIALGRENDLLARFDRELASCSEQALEDQSCEGDTINPCAQICEKKGDFLTKISRHEEALACYWQAFELEPEWFYWRVEEAMLRLSYSEAEITDRLLEGFDRFLEMNPNAHRAWFRQGVICDGAKRYEAALESYDRVVEINPDADYCWWLRALVLEKLRRDEEAIESCDRGLEIKAESIGSHTFDFFRLKTNLLNRLGRYEEAIENYRQAIALVSILIVYNRQSTAFFEDAYRLLSDVRELSDLFHSLEREEEAIAAQNQAQRLSQIIQSR